MVFLFLNWVLIVFVTIALSLAYQHVISAIFKVPFQKLAIDFHIIQGLAVLGGLLLWLNLVVPISTPLQITIIVICALLLFSLRTRIPTFSGLLKHPVIPTVIGLTMLAIASSTIYFYDSNLYHIQAIFWERLYAQVPGLGNLHGRLAFNSSALSLNAFFYTAGGFALNSLLFFMLWFRIFIPFISTKPLRSTTAFFLVSIFALAYFTLVYRGLNSPSPDSFLAVFICYLFIDLQKKSKESQHPEQALLPLTLIVFIPTVKLSAALIPLLAVYAVLKRPSLIWLVFGIAFFFLTPFLLKNFVSSGYVLYPSSAFNFWHPDWQIPLEKVVEMKGLIESFAKNSSLAQGTVLSQPFIIWLPIWFNRITQLQRILFVVQILIGCMVIFRFREMTSFAKSSYFVLFVSLAFWLVSAPDPRFVTGLLAVTTGLFLETFFVGTRLDFVLNNKTKKPILVAALLCIVFKNHVQVTQDLSKKWLFPIGSLPVAYVETQVGAFQVKTPIIGDQCGSVNLPCAPIIEPGLTARSNELADGFKFSKSSVKK